jgi:site-specific DNA recombinase
LSQQEPGQTLFAFYGRVSTEDNQDPASSRAWQLTRSKALIEPRGGVIVAEFFDVDKSRSIPWQRRPEASRLLAELANSERGFSAVVIGEPHRAFYGNQYGLTFPLFQHYEVPLWVPEVGGGIDPANEAHDLVMSVFGGMSKGERQRIKIRVHTAMAAQAQVEGRFLGGRPPYGYVIVDAGPHPNPAKAADGRRLHRLELDPVTADVVARIFFEFLGGSGLFTIAEGLTRDDIPSPSAHDRARNSHRSGIAWSKRAARAILTNPRYTGRQVWNRQRKDEVLLDVNDVAQGHITRLRWNTKQDWIWSEQAAHPAIVSVEDFASAQQVLTGRGGRPTSQTRKRTTRAYQLRGLLVCGVCERRMQAHWLNSAAYYRCRFPQEYALANKLTHPRNVYLREDRIVPCLDRWLARLFEPERIEQTISALLAAQRPMPLDRQAEAARRDIAEADRKLARHRAALEAGADPAVVTGWIKDVQTAKAAAEARLRRTAPAAGRQLRHNELADMIAQFGDMVDLLADADPARKAAIYANLCLRLTFYPQEGKVLVSQRSIGERFVSEGGLEPPCPKRALAPQASASAYSATRTYADHDLICRPPHDSKTSRSAQVRWPALRTAGPSG